MLSKNFSLAEFTRSQTAARHGIRNDLPPALLPDAQWFATNVLEKIRELVGRPVTITSGYRCPELNAKIGGSKASYHMRGWAADIVVDGVSPYTLATAIEESDIKFDKLILEFGDWVHIQGRPPQRNEVLTASYVDGKTRYMNGVVS